MDTLVNKNMVAANRELYKYMWENYTGYIDILGWYKIYT
jgi:hypothetical protein